MTRKNLPEGYTSQLAAYSLQEIGSYGLMLYSYEKGEFLCHEGDNITDLLFIISGKAKVFVTMSNGKNLLLSFYDTQGLIGSAELFTDRITTANVQALTDMECIAMPLSLYFDKLENNPKFLQYLSRVLATIVATSSRNSAMNILYPLETRLCAYILKTSENGIFTDKLTEVSELVGASYRHLLRTLEKMCAQGLIAKLNHGYKVVDHGRMEMFAEDYYSIYDLSKLF